MNNCWQGIKQYEVTWEDQYGLFNKEIVWGADEADVTRHVLGEYDKATVHCVRVIAMGEAPEPCYEFKVETSVDPDMINKPPHYNQGGIECIDAIAAAVTGLTGMEAVCTGNIIRYIWRWKRKNGLEDVKKCRWYIDKLIEELEEQANERTDN